MDSKEESPESSVDPSVSLPTSSSCSLASLNDSFSGIFSGPEFASLLFPVASRPHHRDNLQYWQNLLILGMDPRECSFQHDVT